MTVSTVDIPASGSFSIDTISSMHDQVKYPGVSKNLNLFGVDCLGKAGLVQVTMAEFRKLSSKRAHSSSGYAGGTSWTNPTYLMADGTNGYCYNVRSLDGYSQTFRVRDFGFAIPTNATIKGVYSTFYGYIDNQSDGTGTFDLQLMKDGTNGVGTSYEGNADVGGFTTYWGGPLDLWGTTLTYTEVNSVNFGMRIRGNVTGLTYGDITFNIHSFTLAVMYLNP